MKIIIQKFGGTSTATEETRQHCLKHIKKALSNGYKVVVVVSAMGRKGDPYATDTLFSLLGTPPFTLSKKDKDLFIASGEIIAAGVFSELLHRENIDNQILTGGQAGIITDNNHNQANILSLEPSTIHQSFKQQDVIVVPGFQGVSTTGHLTTLGRGGSDTTATALGVALNASYVDIFTDVDGIYSADPRLVPNAKPLKAMTYNESCNFAQLGAKVIHPRAVEMAMKKNIPIRVRSTFLDAEGTHIGLEATLLEKQAVSHQEQLITGITHQEGLVQLTIKPGEDEKQFPLTAFDLLKENNISIDFISITPEFSTFTVPITQKEMTITILSANAVPFSYKPNDVAKVSLVGGNINGVPGVMARVIHALKKDNIVIYQSADSHSTIWVLIDQKDVKKAVLLLHQAFL